MRRPSPASRAGTRGCATPSPRAGYAFRSETGSSRPSLPRRRTLADRHQVLGGARQHLGLSVRDDHEVLDPDPAEALQVDTRLDCDDVAHGERVGRLEREARRLVHLEPDAVAEAVAELPAEAGGLDLVARGGVCIDAGHAGTDGFEAPELALETRRVGAPQLVGKRPGGVGTRAVGAVVVDHGARVDHDRLPRADRAVAGAGVRFRAVRARGDDGLEGGCVGAELVEELVQPPGQLALGSPDERLVREALVGLARDLPRPADRVELAVVLHRAQRLDEAAARYEVEPAAVQRLPARVADGVGLEADAALEQLRERDDQRALRLDELDARDRPPGLGVAEVAEQPRAVRLDQQGGVRAGEADEVADIDAVRDEERLFEALAQAVDATRHVRPARNSSASR